MHISNSPSVNNYIHRFDVALPLPAMLKRTPKPTGGPLGLWVLLRFRLTLASRALQVHALFPQPPDGKK